MPLFQREIKILYQKTVVSQIQISQGHFSRSEVSRMNYRYIVVGQIQNFNVRVVHGALKFRESTVRNSLNCLFRFDSQTYRVQVLLPMTSLSAVK